MAKHFKTWFGVPIPPWRNKKMGSGQCTIRFVIHGRVPSKKNNQQAICRRKEALEFLDSIKGPVSLAAAKKAVRMVTAKMRGNDKYLKFIEDQRPAIEKQRAFWIERLGDKGLVFPLRKAKLGIRFYFAERYRQDAVNKQQSVQDLLKDLKIIADDDYKCLNAYGPIDADADCFADEIRENITLVVLSFRLRK